jgi:predicted N-acetyltransferase YhbS
MTFENADFEALARLWASFYPSRYAVDADLLRFNTAQCSVFDWGASTIFERDGEVVGFAAVKKSAAPSLFRGPDQDQAHLSAIAFADPFIGVDLLAGVKRILRNRGIFRLVFGQDCRHFFPGCPSDAIALKDFLTVEGFEETGESFDVERDLGDYSLPSKCPELPSEFRIAPLERSQAPLLEAFLQREFPGRWQHDTMAKVADEQRADFVIGLFEGGLLEGFAVTQDHTHRAPIGGAVWRASLGEGWGALGPIGVSAKLRGRGLGDALLGHSLLDLKRRGARQTLIDWTTLDRYYGGHGFKITRRYATRSLRLDA